jgi:hypothetical protein
MSMILKLTRIMHLAGSLHESRIRWRAKTKDFPLNLKKVPCGRGSGITRSIASRDHRSGGDLKEKNHNASHCFLVQLHL